jgi:hypothetical protein
MTQRRAPFEQLTEQQWKRLVTESERAGESAARFAARRSLSPSSFHRWRNRLQAKPAAPLPADNPLVAVALATESLCELRFPDGRTLRFPASIPAQTRRVWFAVLDGR